MFYNSGQTKINIRPACNDCVVVIAQKRNTKKRKWNAINPFLGLYHLDNFTRVGLTASSIMHENLPYKQGLGKGLEQG